MNNQPSDKKQQIIDKAIEFFSKNGIADTKVEDITKAIGIGKGTLYLYFNGKKDLLLNCIERLTTIVIPKDVWLDIREETNYKLRFQKRFVAFLKAYPTFCGILNLINQSLESSDSELSKKAGDAYRLLTGPLVKDLRWASSQGWVRAVDDEAVAFMMLAVGEGLGIMLKIDPRYSIEKLADITWDFMINGIGSSATSNPEEAGSLYWDLSDREGNTVHVRDLCCNDKSYLSGELGKGALQVPLHNITSIELAKTRGALSAMIQMKSGKAIKLIVDPNTSLTGDTEYGRYQVPLVQVLRVSAIEAGDEPSGSKGTDA
jgi:AcrR family transcriptional regulator